MTETKLDTLERCATAAATKNTSPWTVQEEPLPIVVDAIGRDVAFDVAKVTADHIASADPATVLALVRVVRAAAAFELTIRSYPTSSTEQRDALHAALEAFR